MGIKWADRSEGEKEHIREVKREQYRRKFTAPRNIDKQTTMRPCMCCGQDFPSEGIHNRLCWTCKYEDGGMIHV